ncbi:ORFL74C [Human betaherpesvirus 5]|nr:ORFL74C [Human betaherpesvirus 5]QHX40382.1 ORFL74C [Human betaherpesvirus 5]
MGMHSLRRRRCCTSKSCSTNLRYSTCCGATTLGSKPRLSATLTR